MTRNSTVFAARWARLVLVVSLLFGAWPGLASGQEYRSVITGQVTDPNGAVVAGATITAKGPQQTYQAKANDRGDFTIPFVQPGTYDVTAEATGFKKELRQGVVIDVSHKINLNFTLQVGQVSEEVMVQSDAQLLSSGDASGGTVIDSQKTQELPLNGRQIFTLLLYAPGVRYTGGTTTRGWDQTNAYVINGVQNSYNQFTLNGAPISQQISTGRGTWFIAPNVDAVQEVKIMTNTYDASYGRTGGGTVNVVLKSGTDKFHGTAYDFWRNRMLEANTFQNNQRGIPKPFHNQHNFGGTFGGPVPGLGKDKTFFFFSYDAWREVTPSSFVTSAPSADVRVQADGSVDLSRYVSDQKLNGIFNPFSCATTNADGTCRTRNRFTYNGKQDVIPPNLISAIGRKILGLYPLPNNPGAGEFNNYTANARGTLGFNQPIIRIDHNFSDRTKFYGMFSYWSGTQFQNNTGYSEPSALPAIRGNINSYRSFIHQILDLTHTFGPSLVGDVRLSYGRSLDRAPNGTVAAGISKLTPADLGFTNYPLPPTTNEVEAPWIQVAGYPDIIGNNKYGDFGHPPLNETFELSPTLTHTIGRHNLRYGGQIMVLRAIPCCGAADAQGQGIGPGGRFSFGSGFTQQDPNTAHADGAGIASLLLGIPNGGSIPYSLDVYESYHYFAAYVQDDFKLRRNLTLNLGLRWDVETSPRERFFKLNAGFDYNVKNPISDLATFPANNTLANGAKIVNPVVGGFNFASDKLAPYDTQKNHWQPKIGVAWQITPKTVLRGGWGLGYAFAIELGGNTTFTQSTAFVPSVGSTPTNFFNSGNPYPNGLVVPFGNTFGLLSGVGTTQSYDQRSRKIPYVQQYSLGLQRELPGGIMLDVSYVGSYTKDLRVGTQFDVLTPEQFAQGTKDPNFLNQLVPNPFYWQRLNLSGLPAAFVNSYKASDMGSRSSIAARFLMVPWPQFFGNLFSNTEPVGTSNYNSLAVRAEKRISGRGALINGLSFLTSFTWSRTMAANGYLNNGGAGLRDPNVFYAVTGTDRPFDLAFAGTWGVPIGKGGLVAGDAHGALGQLLNNWSLGWILTADSGTPIGIPNGFTFDCPQNNNSYLPKKQTYTEWLYNETPSCFKSFPAFTPTTVLPRFSFIRAPYAPQLAMSLGKKFALREGLNLQFRAEAFNVTNTRIFGGPNTGSPNVATRATIGIKPGEPGSCQGYGCIGSNQQNIPRQIQMSLKVIF